MKPRLGIAITTYNSCDLVVRQVQELRRLTVADFDLVVADDGSTDGTVATLRELGVRVITGQNRGVAWNKNRGLFYLLNKTVCDIIFLLDDDLFPTESGWEKEWIEATERFGHVNYMIPKFFAERVVSGDMTSASPGLATGFFGPLIGCTRKACSYVGYFDVRFGRWGFEHVDFTHRFTRCGFGGVPPEQNCRNQQLYIVLSTGVDLFDRVSTVSSDDKIQLAEKTREFYLKSQGLDIYRCPWNSEDEMLAFRIEMGDEIEYFLEKKVFENNSDKINNQKLFFVHVPKTAGESVNALAGKMIGSDCVLSHIESSINLLNNINSIAFNVRYVSGHHRLPDVLSNIDRQIWFVLTIFRNPVEHLISHLKWVKIIGSPENLSTDDGHEDSIRDLACQLWKINLNDVDALAELIYEGSDLARQLFDNCQTRYMIEYRENIINSRDAQQAVDAIKFVDYIGFTESLSGVSRAMSSALGVKYNPKQIPYVNRAKMDDVVNLHDPAVLKFYREAVRWDAFLYTAAQKLSLVIPSNKHM